MFIRKMCFFFWREEGKGTHKKKLLGTKRTISLRTDFVWLLFILKKQQSWASDTGVGTSGTSTLSEFWIGVVCGKLGVKGVGIEVSGV